ncbi:hypothetical protein AB0A77_11710 [Streptomyces varsoviensis]|uniref:hypothetical protein n=1 Tax=Streptomyces varsoviensis TaxID=67373 RepID=UPI0033C3DD2A
MDRKSNRGGIPRRIARCVFGYLLVFVVGWLIFAAVGPRELDTASDSFGRLSFGESFLQHLQTGAGMLLLIGLPSLLIALLIGFTGGRTNRAARRVLLAFLLLIPCWPVLFASTGHMLLTQVAVQFVFALWIMPIRLTPEDAETTDETTVVHLGSDDTDEY